MQVWLADSPLFGGEGQGVRQLVLLLVAFLLTALIGLERELRGKSAGVRTQSIVGTSAALIMLISKYGFGDVLTPGAVILDPSRIAAQIVTGIGFLGAGLIIFRRGAVHGLTTAAAVWECAAIGMAAGSGLLLLATAVTTLHFVIVLGLNPLAERLHSRLLRESIHLQITYHANRGVLTQLMKACERRRWQLNSLASDTSDVVGETSAVMTLSGPGVSGAPTLLATIEGVTGIQEIQDED